MRPHPIDFVLIVATSKCYIIKSNLRGILSYGERFADIGEGEEESKQSSEPRGQLDNPSRLHCRKPLSSRQDPVKN